MKCVIYLLMITGVALSSASTFAQGGYTPQKGDLLFQEGETGDFEMAIKAVTPAYKKKQFTHVGVVDIEKGKVVVVEAISKGVVVTDYEDFLKREQTKDGKAKVMVGRLKQDFRYAINPAIKRMHQLLGKPYDKVFDLDNDSYYCSELIYKCFIDSANQSLFTVNPMTFNNPKTGELFDKWKAYYEDLNVPVPEGKLGLNPGSMANENVLEMVHSFY